MRVYSTPESVLRNEISILAIIETVIVLSLSLFIAIYYNYFWHIAIGASLGIFLLLRTDVSTHRGLSWLDIIYAKYLIFALIPFKNEFSKKRETKDIHFLQVLIIVYFLLIVGFISFFIKILATLFTVLQKPLYSIKEIPYNWFRIAFAIDLIDPPELIPGIENCDFHDELPKSIKWSVLGRRMFSTIKSTKLRNFSSFLIFSPVIIVYCFMYLPAFLYRFSLKSTTLIYFPLIWLIGGKNQKQKNIKLIVDDLLDSKYERLKYYFSWFAIFVLTIFPLCLSFYWQNLINILSGKEVLIYFFPLEQIGSWHITRFVSALITIILIIFADKLRIRLNHPDYSLGQVKTFFIILGRRLRVILGMWTLGCGFFIIMSIVDWTTFPIIKLFPF